MEEPAHSSEIIDPLDSPDKSLPPTSPGTSSTSATAEIPPDLLHHDEVTGQEYGYNSPASSTTHRSNSDILGQELDDEEVGQVNSRASSRSSVSSLSGSVLPDGMKGFGSYPIVMEPGDEMVHVHDWVDGKDGQLKGMQAIRQRETAFRKPSSVRAMQMHTEDEDDGDEYLTPPKRRGKRGSDISMRSTGSSLLKRQPYYSPSRSASKQKVKKEYPLVLLHCTLLPPSLPIPGLVRPPNQKTIREVLPLEYWRRWKLLEEKVGSGVLRDRGVLISHPEDMYDLLEERLLESLELQRPRLRNGHFLGHEEGDSEKEDQSSPEESATDDEQGEACADCGGRIVRNNGRSRKWEIKVFAANGLMRAGAWAAAWKEMEKVDVEVGLWLPSHIRRELEKRLMDDEHHVYEHNFQGHQLNESNVQMITDAQDQPLELAEAPHAETHLLEPKREVPSSTPKPEPSLRESKSAPEHHRPTHEIDLQTLLINYIRVLANDSRNVAIALLGVLVLFLAIIAGRPDNTPTSHLRPFPQEMFEPVSSNVPMSPSSAAWVDVASSMSMTATSIEASAVPSPSSTSTDMEDTASPSATAETQFSEASANPTTTSTIALVSPTSEELNERVAQQSAPPAAETRSAESESEPIEEVESVEPEIGVDEAA